MKKQHPKKSKSVKFLLGLLFLTLLLPANALYKELKSYKVRKSIVELLTPDGRGGGTGFQISYKGRQFTMTNGHVCELGKSQGYLLLVSPHSRVRKVQILEESKYSDLCLLEPSLALPPLELGSKELKEGDLITVLGHPLLGPLRASPGTVQSKIRYIDVMINYILNKKDREACSEPKNRIREGKFLGVFGICVIEVESQHTNAHIEPGNSGSPVLNPDNSVAGVAFAANSSDGEAEIIPWSSVEFFLNHHIPYYKQHDAPEHP